MTSGDVGYYLLFRLILMLLLAMFASTGCNKNADPLLKPATCLVKNEILRSATGDLLATVTRVYDDQHRILESNTLLPNGINYLHRYQYTDTQIIEATYGYDGKMDQAAIHKLNEQGLVVKSDYLNYSLAGIPTTGSFSQYEYDASGFMTKNSFYASATELYEYWNWTISGGNIVSYSNFNPHSGPQKTETYSYDDDKINSTGNYNTGKTFFGKSNANLVRTSVLVTGSSSETATYTYEYDEHQRVIKMVVEGAVMNSAARIIQYEYY